LTPSNQLYARLHELHELHAAKVPTDSEHPDKLRFNQRQYKPPFRPAEW
jgi:hypothetical protein